MKKALLTIIKIALTPLMFAAITVAYTLGHIVGIYEWIWSKK